MLVLKDERQLTPHQRPMRHQKCDRWCSKRCCLLLSYPRAPAPGYRQGREGFLPRPAEIRCFLTECSHRAQCAAILSTGEGVQVANESVKVEGCPFNRHVQLRCPYEQDDGHRKRASFWYFHNNKYSLTIQMLLLFRSLARSLPRRVCPNC